MTGKEAIRELKAEILECSEAICEEKRMLFSEQEELRTLDKRKAALMKSVRARGTEIEGMQSKQRERLRLMADVEWLEQKIVGPIEQNCAAAHNNFISFFTNDMVKEALRLAAEEAIPGSDLFDRIVAQGKILIIHLNSPFRPCCPSRDSEKAGRDESRVILK
jgi:predicted nuclease with TOPRIM domain